MSSVTITRDEFVTDQMGKGFSDVANDPKQPFGEVLTFFADEDRQRRMEESEIHHNRPALAGVVRELEAQPAINRYMGEMSAGNSKRLRQAIGVLVRMVMEQRGWEKTGRKGSLGVRSARTDDSSSRHNSGGLAFWFIRAERYKHADGMPFQSVRERCRERDGDAQRSETSDAKQPRPSQRHQNGSASKARTGASK